MTGSNFNLVQRLWRQVRERRRRQFLALGGLILVSTLFELASLGLVVPFLAALANPALVLEKLGGWRFVGSGLASWVLADVQVGLTATFCLVAVVAAIVRLVLLWSSNHLASVAGTDLSAAYYDAILHQPYTRHVERHTSEVISGVVVKITSVLGILQALPIVAATLLLLAVVSATLIAVAPAVALLILAAFGGIYVLVAWLARSRLHNNAKVMSVHSNGLMKALQEGLGAIRDVILERSQQLYVQRYRSADEPFRQALARSSFIAGSPRYVVEALGMVVLALTAYVIAGHEGGLVAALPVLGAFALGAQRVLPSLQQGYTSWSQIAVNRVYLKEVLDVLEEPVQSSTRAIVAAALPFQQSLALDKVHFRYSEQGPWVLEDVSINLPKGSSLGVVGETGSGKSTLIDIVLGLLSPTVGELRVDGRVVGADRLGAWQRCVAHVAQQIFLSDASVLENVAFGELPSAIDVARVWRALERACADDFVRQLPAGLMTKVGERGVRLSGGQRQRIGLARALYREASVLVLDEATSALDNSTEKAVMESIVAMDPRPTMIMIAHRLSTVKDCDLLIELRSGRICASGTFRELMESSSTFRAMAIQGMAGEADLTDSIV